MRISINSTDDIVVVDGTAMRSDCTALRIASTSAVQWYGSDGDVEYAGHVRPNQRIDDFSPYQVYVDNAVPLQPPEPALNPALDSFAPKSIRSILGV